MPPALLSNQIERAIQAGLTHLSHGQKADGSFASAVSPNPLSHSATVNSAIFATALIAVALEPLKERPEARRIAEKATQYLISQVDQRTLSWNYWKRQSPDAARLPYPDDLDDTAVCLTAIKLWQPSWLTGPRLAKIVTLLRFLATKPGGPYKTWVYSGDDPNWSGLDPVPNANIGYFLSLFGATVPSLEEYLREMAVNSATLSPYYDGVWAPRYFLSKSLPHIPYFDTPCSSLVDRALALSTHPAHKGATSHVRAILKHPHYQAHSYWEHHGWIREAEGWAGSSFLTTALTIEALTRYKQVHNISPQVTSSVDVLENTRHIQDFLSALPSPFQTTAHQLIKEYFIPSHQVYLTSLPTKISTSFGLKDAPSSLLDILSQVVLAGWLGYTILDDYADGDRSDPASLPLSQWCSRYAYTTLLSIAPRHKGYQTIVQTVFDNQDTALQKELTMYRFSPLSPIEPGKLPPQPAIDFLSNRSLGHALVACALLAHGENQKSHNKLTATLTYYRNYLAARQLQDDAHDWLEDLKKGRYTVANIHALRIYGRRFTLDDERALHAVMTIYWKESIPSLFSRCLTYIAAARRAMGTLTLAQNDPFEEPLKRLEEVARKTLAEYKRTTSFLESFHKPTDKE
jgi:hypothetical protein